MVSKNPGKLRLETPAGLVLIDYVQEGKKVKSVKLTNVKSFLYAEDLEVDCPNLGLIKVDVAYGGNFYGIIDSQENFRDISDFTASQLIHYGKMIRKLLNEKYSFIHPEDENINGLSHIQWTGKPVDSNASGRNAVLVGENALDRSPCGTGTSARMAQWYAKGKLKQGEEFIHESYILDLNLLAELRLQRQSTENPLSFLQSKDGQELQVIIILLSTMKILIGWDFRLCKHIYDTK